MVVELLYEMVWCGIECYCIVLYCVVLYHIGIVMALTTPAWVLHAIRQLNVVNPDLGAHVKLSSEEHARLPEPVGPSITEINKRGQDKRKVSGSLKSFKCSTFKFCSRDLRSEVSRAFHSQGCKYQHQTISTHGNMQSAINKSGAQMHTGVNLTHSSDDPSRRCAAAAFLVLLWDKSNAM